MNIIIMIIIALGIGGGVYVVNKPHIIKNSISTETSTENKVVATNNVATPENKDTKLSSSGTLTAKVNTNNAIKIGNYKLIASESVIGWEASKPLISGYTHHGTIGVSAGTLAVTDAAFSGNFTIDMKAIKVTSLGGGKAGNESLLEGHLMGENFFNSAKFPTGTFTIDSVTSIPKSDAYNVKGKLTLKGVTKPVEFPVVITQSASGKVTATGPIIINRTLWGITYASGTFFDNLANNAIDDNIKLTLKLVAQ